MATTLKPRSNAVISRAVRISRAGQASTVASVETCAERRNSHQAVVEPSALIQTAPHRNLELQKFAPPFEPRNRIDQG
jgi:hypothetical protein